VSKKPVLIAAASFDQHAYGPVSRHLNDAGYPVIVYKTDKLLAGDDCLVIDLRDDRPLVYYNGASILPEDISAAWYRKIGHFGISDADTQLAKQLYMNNEVRSLHDTIWPYFYPEDVWLSAPAKIGQAERKLKQIRVARDIGFHVPDTIVSSDWGAIQAALVVDERTRIIVKMIRGVISDGDRIKTLPTTILDQRRIDEIKEYTSPFPGLYQPYIEKAREWRVTVVGDTVFPAAIYTVDAAKDDWRKHQNSVGSVTFRRDALPDDVSEYCVAYLKAMDLRYGAFDLVEEPSGRVVFLECNPDGQYGWLEEDLGLPISHAIASELMKIAHVRG